MNFWHMQLHPDDKNSWSPEDILRIITDFGVIGMGDSGESWKNSKRQPEHFKDDASIGDIVVIRHGPPLCLVEIISDCKKNEGEDAISDVWFTIYRRVKLLATDGPEQQDGFEAKNNDRWFSGINVRSTFNAANHWRFIHYWYDNYTQSVMMEKYKTLLLNNKNIVLTGAPGTGKTYLAYEIAGAIGDKSPGFVQFHPSYDYSDFVEGLRPTEDGGFKREDGVFKLFCKKALKDCKTHVFIIDEINRGELSKIFGELFFAIDPEYRGGKKRIFTQYQNLVPGDDDFKPGFYVPENVFIIGTMNDIDRGVESMDFAIRRRFAWKEVTAKERETMLDELIPQWSSAAKHCMHEINTAIEQIPGLSSAYHIGPAYFSKLNKYNGDFVSLWEYHIEGIIREYLRGTRGIEERILELRKIYLDNSVAK